LQSLCLFAVLFLPVCCCDLCFFLRHRRVGPSAPCLHSCNPCLRHLTSLSIVHLLVLATSVRHRDIRAGVRYVWKRVSSSWLRDLSFLLSLRLIVPSDTGICFLFWNRLDRLWTLSKVPSGPYLSETEECRVTCVLRREIHYHPDIIQVLSPPFPSSACSLL
jgi:hypothetical protein